VATLTSEPVVAARVQLASSSLPSITIGDAGNRRGTQIIGVAKALADSGCLMASVATRARSPFCAPAVSGSRSSPRKRPQTMLIESVRTVAGTQNET
jgi:hypothetical protein